MYFWKYADDVLAMSIIVFGIVWVMNIFLSYCIRFIEIARNFNFSHSSLHEIPLWIILKLFILILFVPLEIYHKLMKRTYLIEKEDYETYFGEYNTENDDVTFFGTEVEAKFVLNLVLKLLKHKENCSKEYSGCLFRDDCLYEEIKKYLGKNKMKSEEKEEENRKISVILAERLKKKLKF